MEDYIVNWIVSGVMCWTSTFLIIRTLLPNRSFDFCNRLVSTIHALVAVSLASISVQDWKCPVCPLASRSSQFQMKALSVTLSYLIYDLICCLFDKKVSLDNSVHHLVSIVGIGAGLFYERCGSEMVAAMWITEISSPFLHMRELLKELGYRDTDLNLAMDLPVYPVISKVHNQVKHVAILKMLSPGFVSEVDCKEKKLRIAGKHYSYILFSVIFSAARMVYAPYLTYATLTADNPLLVKAMGLGLQLVSAFWFYRIVRMVRYKLAKRMAPSKTVSNH